MQNQSPDLEITKKEDALALQTKGKTIDGLPSRSGYGTLGKKTVFNTNYFKLVPFVDDDKDVALYRYNVDTRPELSKAKQRQLMTQLGRDPLLSSMVWATDYAKTIITTQKLNFGPGRDHGIKTVVLDPPNGASQQSDTGPVPDFVQSARQRNTVQCRISYTRSYSLAAMADYLSSESGDAEYAGSADLIQLLNIIITKPPNSSDTVAKVGKNKFYPFGSHPLADRFDLPGPFEAHRGYFSSVRPAVGRLLLNLNVISGAFYQPLLLMDALAQFGGSIGDQEGFCEGLKVEAIYIKDRQGAPFQTKTKKIFSFGKRVNQQTGQVKYLNADEATFKYKDLSDPNAPERDTTVYNYFKHHWGITLQHRKEIVLNVATAKDPQYMPQEICKIPPGQPYNRLLQAEQRSQMIRFAARPPNVNAMSIAGTSSNPGNGLKLVRLASPNGPDPQITSVQRFGFSVKKHMITVPGRILVTPQVTYNNKAGPKRGVSKGSWNLEGMKFHKGCTFKKWQVLVINHKQSNRTVYALSNQPNVIASEELFDLMASEFQNYRMNMGSREKTQAILLEDLRGENRSRNDGLVAGAIKEAKNRGVQMLFIVLPSQDRWLYSRIKLHGDVNCGVHTVNAVGRKFQKFKDQGSQQLQFIGNLALKMNVKGGGVSHVVPDTLKGPVDYNTMLLGIDVTHPSPGSHETAPSIACAVANTDSSLFHWPGSIRPQTGRQEMVDSLIEMVKERLKTFNRKNGRYPNRVVVYRDGVSEGQFKTVLEVELPLIEEAYKEVYGDKDKWPKTAIIIVGKRHHTRFYPTNVEDADGDARSGKGSWNPLPGTVVDRGIVGKVIREFYLQAHQGLQGTAKPAHYSVIKDDVGFTADQLEEFTHKLCYYFARCTRAVSVCPPAYYADLLAERGRAYLYVTLQENKSRFNINTAEWKGGVHCDLVDSTWYV